MKKLVAIEKIFGMFSKITYAEKNEELDFIKDWDNEIGYYRNIRTQETFHAKKEKIGYIEQSDIFLFVETEQKKQKQGSTKRKIDADNKNQIELW